MQDSDVKTARVMQLILSCGAGKAAEIQNKQITLSAEFREICKSNGCGLYGKCYMCPPDIGDIETLMAQVRSFDNAVLYQSVYALEDSYDFEGMQAAGAAFNRISREIHKQAKRTIHHPFLHLAAGGCRVCETCAKRDNLPCKYPQQALSSLEAYGVDVYQTALSAGLQYINGTNTVTYFGMILI